LAEIANAVIDADDDAVKEMVGQAIAEGQDVQKILAEGLITGMSAVGDKFESGEFFLPEMIIASKTMKEGLELLRPLLQQTEVKSSGVVVLGTVKGDIHDIGKGIVGIMREGGGFMVTDIGVDVDPHTFVEAANEIGADGYAPDAPTAVRAAAGLLEQK
jgi:5-methyltetrahydrofolate--homocysteine methyltransferase